VRDLYAGSFILARLIGLGRRTLVGWMLCPLSIRPRLQQRGCR
jgi:hypothetical protein